MTAKIVQGVGEVVLLQMLRDLDKKVGKVGWLDGKAYKDGPIVAMVAMQNEYGNATLRIPPRPFLRPTIKAREKAWSEIARRTANQVLEGKAKTEKIFELVGQQASGDFRKAITKVQEPPLAHATVAARIYARKGKGIIGKLLKPLIDSGVMMNSLTYAVEDE